MFPVTRPEWNTGNPTRSETRDISGKYILCKGKPVLHVLARTDPLRPHAFILIQEVLGEEEPEVESTIYRADFGPDIKDTTTKLGTLKTIVLGNGKITIHQARSYSVQELAELREKHDIASREIKPEQAESIKSKIASAKPGMYSVSGELQRKLHPRREPKQLSHICPRSLK
jgi:hypothetical protein